MAKRVMTIEEERAFRNNLLKEEDRLRRSKETFKYKDRNMLDKKGRPISPKGKGGVASFKEAGGGKPLSRAPLSADQPKAPNRVRAQNNPNQGDLFKQSKKNTKSSGNFSKNKRAPKSVSKGLRKAIKAPKLRTPYKVQRAVGKYVSPALRRVLSAPVAIGAELGRNWVNTGQDLAAMNNQLDAAALHDKELRAIKAKENADKEQKKNAFAAQYGIERNTDGSGRIPAEAIVTFRKNPKIMGTFLSGTIPERLKTAPTEDTPTPVTATPETEPEQALPAGLSRNAQGQVVDDTGAVYFGDNYLGNIKDQNTHEDIALQLKGRGILRDAAESKRLNNLPEAKLNAQLLRRELRNAERTKQATQDQARLYTRAAGLDSSYAPLAKKAQQDLMRYDAMQVGAQRAAQERRKSLANLAQQNNKRMKEIWSQVSQFTPEDANKGEYTAEWMMRYAPILDKDNSPKTVNTLLALDNIRDDVGAAVGDAAATGLSSFWAKPVSINNPAEMFSIMQRIADGIQNNQEVIDMGDQIGTISRDKLVEALWDRGIKISDFMQNLQYLVNKSGGYDANKRYPGGFATYAGNLAARQ